jgi:hypothetical protein
LARPKAPRDTVAASADDGDRDRNGVIGSKVVATSLRGWPRRADGQLPTTE